MPRDSNVHTVQIVPQGTQLATIASSMIAGQWQQLTGGNSPTGLNLFTNNAWFSAKVTGYATKFARDTTNKRLYYAGGDHNTPCVFLVFDEFEHSWRNAHNGTQTWTFPVVPWGPQSLPASPPSHAYEHNIFDTTRNQYWHRPYNTRVIQRWGGGTSWTSFPYTSIVDFGQSAGCCYFPELDRIIVFQSNGNASQSVLFGMNPANGTTTIYANPGILTPGAEWDCFAHYSPQHQRVVFGGGANGGGDNVEVWTVRSNGAGGVTIEQLPGTRPGALGKIGPGETGISLPFINPSNGHLICIANSSTWYELNILTGTWTAKSGTASVLTGNLHASSGGGPFGTQACSINEYGVVVFVKGYSGSSPAEMWLYKP